MVHWIRARTPPPGDIQPAVYPAGLISSYDQYNTTSSTTSSTTPTYTYTTTSANTTVTTTINVTTSIILSTTINTTTVSTATTTANTTTILNSAPSSGGIIQSGGDWHANQLDPVIPVPENSMPVNNTRMPDKTVSANTYESVNVSIKNLNATNSTNDIKKAPIFMPSQSVVNPTPKPTTYGDHNIWYALAALALLLAASVYYFALKRRQKGRKEIAESIGIKHI